MWIVQVENEIREVLPTLLPTALHTQSSFVQLPKCLLSIVGGYFSPSKTGRFLLPSYKHTKRCLPLTQCWIIDNELGAVYSLCLPHMCLLTTLELGKRGQWQVYSSFHFLLALSAVISLSETSALALHPLSCLGAIVKCINTRWIGTVSGANWERRGLVSHINMLSSEEFANVFTAN